jgi:osmotically-inducible protein OsmY
MNSKLSTVAAALCFSIGMSWTAPAAGASLLSQETPAPVQAPSPQDQSDKKEDVELTRKIREEITQHTKLSMNAKNVKIVTKDGVTHLRGAVKTGEEKEIVESIAKRHAGEGKVQSHLEVTP